MFLNNGTSTLCSFRVILKIQDNVKNLKSLILTNFDKFFYRFYKISSFMKIKCFYGV